MIGYLVAIGLSNAFLALLLANIAIVWNRWTPWLGAAWLLGSGVILAWSLVRVLQFSRLLRTHTETAAQELLKMAAEVAGRLQLGTVPAICTTSANISPMVWWTGGQVRVVIPTTLLEQMERRQWRWVLAHELAHVRRRDYLVRWLEWLSRVCCWWNPMVWWAQRNLRCMEEICCDALVISALKAEPHSYAASILTTFESLARRMLRPPAMASEITSGGLLERRFNMMISNRVDHSNSRTGQVLVWLVALVLLPLGIAAAQDYDAVEKRLGTAVSEGELTLRQANVMMDALKKVDDKQYRQVGDGNRERVEGRFREVGKQLKAAVAAGELTEEEAWARWHGLQEGQVGPRLKVAVESGKLTGEEARRLMRGIKQAEAGKRLKAAVSRGDLTEKEAWSKWAEIQQKRDHDAEMEGHFKRMGVDAKSFDTIQIALKESGLPNEKMTQTLGGMLRVMHALRSEGERFELDPRLRDYFDEEVGLTDEQIELVQGLSRRIFHSLRQPNRGWPAMADPRRRLFDGDERPNWDAIKRRMEGAVERGDLTREEADAKYGEIKKKMSRKEDPDELNWDAIKRRIEGAVERGDLTREEADAKYRELRE